MGNADRETAFAALRQVVETLWSNQRRPILGSRLKKELLDKLESQGLEFSEQATGFKSFVDFVAKSGFLTVRARPGTGMLVVPSEEAALLTEPHEETKERVRGDFWRAFVGFRKAGEKRYFDPAKDQVLNIPESAVQPALPEIVPFTKEEQLGWRREFAEKIDPGNPLRERLLGSFDAPKPLWRRRAFGPEASAAVAATIESRSGIKGKAHGRKSIVRDYPLALPVQIG